MTNRHKFLNNDKLSEYRIVERICKCLRFIIRFLSTQSGPILEILANTIVEVYRKHTHSCFLYLTSILVDEIGEKYAEQLQPVYESLAQPTMELLQKEDGFRQNPDHVDDFCRLSARMAEQTGEHFYRGKVLEAAFKLAIAATKLDHRDASQSMYKFLLQVPY